MSKLIAAVDRPVRPDYRMFGIEDRGSTGDPTPTPGGDWLGVGATGVLIGVGEQLVSPHLRLEIWDGPPPDAPPGHEAQQTVQLLLPTGNLAVNEITGGWSDGLPDVAPGRYHVRITAWNQEKTRQDYADLGDDWDSPEFEAAAAALEGQERYLVQLWLAEPTARLVTEIALKIHAGYPLFAFADEGIAYTVTLPAPGSDWLSATETAVLIQVADQQNRPSLWFQHWDGPPPATDRPAHHFPLSVPSGGVAVMHLKSAHADRNDRSGGAIRRFFTVPPGDYLVRVSFDAARQRYTAQFWPE